MDAKEQFKVEIVLQQINSKLAFCRQSLQLLLDEGGKFEIINEAQKTINRILPQINPD